jgi:hypothetical protein
MIRACEPWKVTRPCGSHGHSRASTATVSPSYRDCFDKPEIAGQRKLRAGPTNGSLAESGSGDVVAMRAIPPNLFLIGCCPPVGIRSKFRAHRRPDPGTLGQIAASKAFSYARWKLLKVMR